MIDWHNHILPGMDDGSKDVEQSLAMLEMQTQQGVETVIATPHFYANDESVGSFLDRREKVFEALKAELPEQTPEILLGAEVRYYEGISRMSDLKDLRIEGSKLLLLEMPMAAWTEYTVRELLELSGKTSVQIVLAHVDRYIGLQKRTVWDTMAQNGIMMQVNADSFTSFSTKRKVLGLLAEGMVQFVGSDCHNLTSRPPQIGKAFEVIRKKFGDNYIDQMQQYGYSLFATTK